MHKIVNHLPAPVPPPPASAAPAPRLAVQLFVAIGELLTLAACVLGIVTAVCWLLKPPRPPVDTSIERRMPSPWTCGLDRHGVEWCRHDDRSPARRHYAR